MPSPGRRKGCRGAGKGIPRALMAGKSNGRGWEGGKGRGEGGRGGCESFWIDLNFWRLFFEVGRDWGGGLLLVRFTRY